MIDIHSHLLPGVDDGSPSIAASVPVLERFASDNHGDSRSLATARDWLLEVATPEHAELLTRTNARRLLDGAPLVPVPPLPKLPGIFGRLRELFLRR